MIPYWTLFAIWAAGAIALPSDQSRRISLIFFVVAATFTALMIGLRYLVGGDWTNYEIMYETISILSLSGALSVSDPFYAILNWAAALVGFEVWFANLVCGILFTVGVARLSWDQPNPWLSMLVAVPYLIIVVAMGYTRQAAAIGIICYAIATSSDRKPIRLIILVLIAALMHKSAVLVLPMLFVPFFRRNILLGIAGALSFAGIFSFVLLSDANEIITNYVQSDYDSQGAAVRISMNVLAAIVLLLTYKKANFPPLQRSFWITSSFLAIGCAVLLPLLPASSGLDRIALFLIPLQLVAISRLPYALSTSRGTLFFAIAGVVAYCFLVQFVWINYADNSRFWLPYQTVIGQDG